MRLIAYAIAAAARNGTPAIGAVVYSTRYPFSTTVFQAHMMGIKKIIVKAHEWEPYYKDEFRKAARLSRELNISIEPISFKFSIGVFPVYIVIMWLDP